MDSYRSFGMNYLPEIASCDRLFSIFYERQRYFFIPAYTAVATVKTRNLGDGSFGFLQREIRLPMPYTGFVADQQI
jgi:hypothetical protein